MKILIINGPNLNLLGKREPEVYGAVSFEKYFDELKSNFPEVSLSYLQSNIEGELIDFLQQADGVFDGVILNAGGYTHTSVSIADAIAAIAVPVVEVHISQPAARESYRHNSLIASKCKGSVSGFGLHSYEVALRGLCLSIMK